MTPVNAPPTANLATHLPGEKSNTPQRQERKNLNWWEHTTDNSTNSPQTTDNTHHQDTARVDGTTTKGTHGMVRCDTTGRVLACLHQQQRNPHVPNKPTKHPGTDSPHMCQRVPSQLAPEPLKINRQRHRGFQDLPRRPYGAHCQTRHTRQPKENTLGYRSLGTPMHPEPD